MVIIKLLGGLGNQMFQYALYKRFQSLGADVYLDEYWLKKYGNVHNGLELKKVFDLEYRVASIKDVKRLSLVSVGIKNRIHRKIFGFNKQSHYIEVNTDYKKEILQMDEVYLEGYWQSYKYFDMIEKEIRKQFSFSEVDDRNRELYNRIKNSASVSIHVRRGDYMNGNNIGIYGEICTEKYYRDAINYVKQHVKNPYFYIFTDDTEWCRKFFHEGTIVDWNSGLSSYKDMQLMSCCKYNIIANSTFSWWAAWLNNYSDKLVIAPEHWVNNMEMKDIYMDEWIKIGG